MVPWVWLFHGKTCVWETGEDLGAVFGCRGGHSEGILGFVWVVWMLFWAVFLLSWSILGRLELSLGLSGECCGTSLLAEAVCRSVSLLGAVKVDGP